MNLIGQIGNIIVGYQDEITIVLLAAAAIIVLFALVRTFNNIEKTKDSIEEISEIVSEINSTVNKLGQGEHGNREVIYIDNRTENSPQEKGTCAEVSKTEQQIEAALERVSSLEDNSPQDEPKKNDENPETEMTAEPEKEKQQEALIEETCSEPEEVPEVKKYFNRNDSVSKNGKKYTKEELEKQIR